MSGKRGWVSDADLVNISKIKELTQFTKQVEQFIEGEGGWMFLSANKGMGKTHLITLKRMTLSENKESATFIPQNEPFLANLSIMPNLTKNMRGVLDRSNLVRVWLFSLKLSAISHYNLSLEEYEEEKFSHMNVTFIKWISNEKHKANPGDVFNELISLGYRELRAYLDTYYNTINRVFGRIKNSTYIFIDKIDQALLEEVQPEFWINIQGALIEAAWDINVDNKHVKVFATIRQEAYANYRSPKKPNFSDGLIELNYSKKQLKEILDCQSSYYEGLTDFNDFLGRKILRNEDGLDENSFDYILRHTMQRPRDLSKIASRLSNKFGVIEDVSDSEIVEVVSNVANSEIIPVVFDEVKPFLEALNFKDSTDDITRTFFSLLRFNILSMNEVQDVFMKLNQQTEETIDHVDHSKLFHPFVELYRSGLLGFIEGNTQRFKKPNQFQNYNSFKLPQSHYYILHPGLKEFIRTMSNQSAVYSHYKFIIIGNGFDWDQSLNRFLVKVQRHVALSTSSRVRKFVDEFLEANLELFRKDVSPDLEKLQVLIDTIYEDYELFESKQIGKSLSPQASDSFISLINLFEELHNNGGIVAKVY